MQQKNDCGASMPYMCKNEQLENLVMQKYNKYGHCIMEMRLELQNHAKNVFLFCVGAVMQ